MLDVKLLRENPDLVRRALASRGDEIPLDRALSLDSEYRRLLHRVEVLRAERRKASRELGLSEEKPPERIAELRRLSEELDAAEAALRQAAQEWQEMLLQLPNIPDPSVPVGRGEEGNVIVRTKENFREFDFKPLPHWDLGPRLGIIDFERGVKLSGTRFYVLRGAGALLQRSLIAFMLDLHTKEHGYKEVYPPFMVKAECMVGSGNLPRFKDNLYHDAEEDFWFIPTAEVPLTNLHRDEVLEPGTLPIYYVAYTACFRREKMAAGRETRGLKRGHQFDKVELYKFVEPETSMEELEKLVADAEDVLKRLGLPYRVKLLCTGELGFAAAKAYDLDVWAPGVEEWLEVSSCSNCTDFQARRANIRYRPRPGVKPQFVHTLNGSGVALPRLVIALLENYQQPDGSVLIPEVLRPYMKMEVITPE